MDGLMGLSLITVLAPLFGAIVVGLLNKKISVTISHWLTCSLMAVAFTASAYILYQFVTGKFVTWDYNLYVWGQSGSLAITVGFLIDNLTALMMTVVTFVSLMVHVYSIGYMHDDPGYQRFFSYISLFTFSMLMLVMSNNFAQLFFGWEAVGLLSYLLIGFWFKKSSANFASLKAFLINRVGDLGFILGIAAILYYFDSLHYKTIFSQVNSFIAANNTISAPGATWPAVSFICICLFIGAMAKSAQIPLHVWLPDSMEGPTPISALIHAATMVTAGIFMVARMSPLFEYSDAVLSLMVLVGSMTCLLMGILAVVQSDIKRIIAYSTLSQLGYMVVALGVSAYSAAIFHLFTHAFFKALLFLGAGSVILAMHHDQNIFNMGNLKRYMPITTAAMFIGGWALMGIPGTSGFYSKDLIIATARNSSLSIAPLGYHITLVSVFITTLYTFRMNMVVFRANENMSQEVREHLKESPKVVLLPLILLAIPSLFVGMFMITPILNDFFGEAIFVLPAHDVLAAFKEEFHGALPMFLHGFISLEFMCILFGGLIAWLCYIKYQTLPKVLKQDVKPVVKILRAKYGFDAFNEKVIMPIICSVGRFCWQIGDVLCIDGLVNGSAQSIGRIAATLRNVQTGYLYHYVFIIVSGLLALLIWTMYL